LKGQWAVAYRSSGAPFVDLDASVFIPAPIKVGDSVHGAGFASIQMNARGLHNSFQNYLRLRPDRLEWNLSIFDSQLNYVLNRELDYILNFNVDDLAGCSLRMSFWGDNEMVLEIRDPVQNLVQGLHTTLPGQWVDPIVSAYVAFCGYGEGSFANFDQLVASVKLQSPSVDITAEAYPFASKTLPPFFPTAELSNTYQDVLANVPGEAVISVGVGPWA
jgi:hypothetical protein